MAFARCRCGFVKKNVPDKLIGRKAKCPKCGESILIKKNQPAKKTIQKKNAAKEKVSNASCPKCGFVRKSGDVSCSKCGAIYAKVEAKIKKDDYEKFLKKKKEESELEVKRLIADLPQKEIINKTYEGRQAQATKKFQIDSEKMLAQGYYPISQSWAPGSYGPGEFIAAFILCFLLVGILIFIYMLIVKPKGVLAVTYELRKPTLNSSVDTEPDLKTCPRCAEKIKAAALVCRYCGEKLKKNNDKPTTLSRDSVLDSDSSIDHITLLDFVNYSESMNKIFKVGWSDFDTNNNIGGYRKSGEGAFILAKNDKPLVKGKLQRPNDGKVANNGTFIINDWMFGQERQDTFYAFDKDGNQLVKHYFEANTYNSDISINGEFAVCQCARSDTIDDGVLAFFDLKVGKLLWKQKPDCGRVDSYSFDCEKQILYLNYKDGGAFRYSFSGDFLDNDKLEAQKEKNRSAFDLSYMAKNRLKGINENLTSEEAKEILTLLRNALKKGLDDYPNEKASVYRAIGEVYELFGKINDAIKNYEIAIKINPKVGVKRRLNKLKQNQN